MVTYNICGLTQPSPHHVHPAPSINLSALVSLSATANSCKFYNVKEIMI